MNNIARESHSSDFPYRSQRKSTRTSEKLLCYSIVIFFITTMFSIVFHLNQLIKIDKLESELIELESIQNTANKELEILRTLNPYQVHYTDIIAQAVDTMSLYPGWVTRVYPVPENIDQIYNMMDIGSFILDETLFTLTSHKQYGITHASSALYRLNALYPSYATGRHQIGVQLGLTEKNQLANSQKLNDATCFVRVEIDGKRIIDSRARIFRSDDVEKVLTGEVSLNAGVHPITAIFYCDKNSQIRSEDIVISLSFRNPGDYSLSNNRNSVYHIYKNEFKPKS